MAGMLYLGMEPHKDSIAGARALDIDQPDSL